MGAPGEKFHELQRSFFENADVEHFRWQTTNRLIAATERELLAGFRLPVDGNFLEVGCGEGGNLANLLSGVDARSTVTVGLDLFERKVNFGSRQVTAARFVCGDALSLPFRDGTFDAVLCRDLLHHITDRDLVLTEVRRVCRPGGIVWIVEPNGRNVLMMLLAAIRPHERGLLQNSVSSLQELVSAHFDNLAVEVRQPMPVYRLLLHHQFGLPALGGSQLFRDLVLGFEKALGKVLPQRWWAYILVKIRT